MLALVLGSAQGFPVLHHHLEGVSTSSVTWSWGEGDILCARRIEGVFQQRAFSAFTDKGFQTLLQETVILLPGKDSYFFVLIGMSGEIKALARDLCNEAILLTTFHNVGYEIKLVWESLGPYLFKIVGFILIVTILSEVQNSLFYWLLLWAAARFVTGLFYKVRKGKSQEGLQPSSLPNLQEHLSLFEITTSHS